MKYKYIYILLLLTSCYSNEFTVKKTSIPERSKPKLKSIETSVAYGDIHKSLDSSIGDEKRLLESILLIRKNKLDKADSLLNIINTSNELILSQKKVLLSYTESLYKKYNIRNVHMDIINNQKTRIKIKDNLIYIDVDIDNNIYTFLVDNGFKTSVISRELIDKFERLPINAKSTSIDMNGIAVEEELFQIKELKIANLKINNILVSVKDNEKVNCDYAGVIGMDILSQFDVYIDFRKSEIDFKESKPAKNEGEYLYSWLGTPTLYAMSCEVYELRLLLDLGANTSFIFSKLFNTFPIEKKVVKTRTAEVKGGNSYKEYSFDIVKDVCVHISGKEISFEKIAINDYMDFLPTLYFGLLGNDLWLNGEIRLDYKNGIFEYYDK